MQHLSIRAIADMLAVLVNLEPTLIDPITPVAPPRTRHDVPFAKRAEGRARRLERRQVRAAKSYWLDS